MFSNIWVWSSFVKSENDNIQNYDNKIQNYDGKMFKGQLPTMVTFSWVWQIWL